MDDEIEVKNQHKAFGFPGGRRERNPIRHRDLKALQRRRERLGPATVGQGSEAFGYAALAIPELDYYVLIARFPDLNSKDAEIQKLAWQKFCRNPMSEPYRVDRSIGKKKPATRIVVK